MICFWSCHFVITAFSFKYTSKRRKKQQYFNYISSVHYTSTELEELCIYKKDSKSKTGYSLYKSIKYSYGEYLEMSKQAAKVSVTLPKGTYYFSVSILSGSGSSDSYDTAFKYTVKELTK